MFICYYNHCKVYCNNIVKGVFVITRIKFSTGEFAKICNTTKNTLFHYEKEKIFEPAFRDSNGYRYYTEEQIEAFFLIVCLKEIGMTSKEVKSYLSKRSPKELLILLDEQEKIINKKIRKLKHIKKIMKNTQVITEKALQVEINKYYMIECEEQFLVTTEDISNLSQKDIIYSISNLERLCFENNIDTYDNLGKILDFKGGRVLDFNNYNKYYFRLVSKKGIKSFHVKEKGTYLTFYCGGNENILTIYNNFISYINDKKYEVCSPFYETPVLNEASTSGSKNYLIEISIKIRNIQ